MKSKKLISLLLLAAMLTSTIACGSEGDGNTNDTTTAANEDTTVQDEYVFPTLDCNNDAFNILNIQNVWSMYTYIDFEAQTGETLDDAVYNRNRKVEELFNVDLNVIEDSIDNVHKLVRTSVMADDDEYDVAYIKGEHIGGIISDKLVTDLSTVPGLNLNEKWWNQNVVNDCSIGSDGALYFAINDLSLTAFDLTWCLMFNETMMEDMQLDKPYDLVRDGKWTFDALHEYTKQGANLNGDESFTFSVDGSSVYGFTSYNNIVATMMTGANCRYTENKNGEFSIAFENDRFYSFCEKMADLTKTEGEYLEANSGDQHYERIFKAGRALFIGAEIKASSVFRDLDDTFGILPAPKLNEEQSDYYAWTNFLVPLMTIPTTNNDLERTGIILDALSYLSTRDVLPLYYGVTVSQKGLRNEDSIEMLDIIRDARYFDPSLAYGWSTSFFYALRSQLVAGDGSVASLIATHKEAITKKIDDTMTLVQ